MIPAVVAPTVPATLAAWVPLLDTVCSSARNGESVALVGARGSGLSSVLRLTLQRLAQDPAIQLRFVDFARDSAQPFAVCAEALASARRTAARNRGVGDEETAGELLTRLLAVLRREIGAAGRLVLVFDHLDRIAPDLQAALLSGVRRVQDLHEERVFGQGTVSFVLGGAMDYRGLQQRMGTSPVTNQSQRFELPRLSFADLWPLFEASGARRRCEWPDEVRRVAYDLCGDDLALLWSLLEHLPEPRQGRLTDADVHAVVDEMGITCIRLRELASLLDDLSPEARRELAAVLGGRAWSATKRVFDELSATRRELLLAGVLAIDPLSAMFCLRSELVARLLAHPARGFCFPRSPRLTSAAAAYARCQQVELLIRRLLFAHLRDPPGGWREVLGRLPVEEEKTAAKGEARLRAVAFRWADQRGGAGAKQELATALAAAAAEERARPRRTLVDLVDRERLRARATRGPKPPVAESGGDGALDSCADWTCYLTFAQLGAVLQTVGRELCPGLADEALAEELQTWERHLQTIRDIRNDVAHFRPVSLESLADLTHAQSAFLQALSRRCPSLLAGLPP